MLRWTRVPSPLGPLLLVATERGLCACDFCDEGAGPCARSCAAGPVVEDPRGLADEAEQVGRYFAGDLCTFRVRLDPLLGRGAWDRAVWKRLRAIPFGETRTYGEIARAVDRPPAARAVGGACGRNPLTLLVPCHRVVGGDGRLTGYGSGLERKRWLLEHERRVRGAGRAGSGA